MKKVYYEKNKDKILEKQKEYKLENIEYIRERDRQYHETNADKLKVKHKEYYENKKNEILERRKTTIVCECGKSFRNCDKARHFRSKNHINTIALQQDNKQ